MYICISQQKIEVTHNIYAVFDQICRLMSSTSTEASPEDLLVASPEESAGTSASARRSPIVPRLGNGLQTRGSHTRHSNVLARS